MRHGLTALGLVALVSTASAQNTGVRMDCTSGPRTYRIENSRQIEDPDGGLTLGPCVQNDEERHLEKQLRVASDDLNPIEVLSYIGREDLKERLVDYSRLELHVRPGATGEWYETGTIHAIVTPEVAEYARDMMNTEPKPYMG